MGTDGQPSSRAGNRGLASFVAFLLLFAFALGSGSLMAIAGGGSESVSRGSALPAPAGSKVSATSGGATSVTRSTPSTGTLKTARSTRSDALAAPAAPPVTGLAGGDIGLDFVAAGPFTYNHATGLGSPPQFGYDNRTISKTNGVVESLEGGDFECGDLVTFFTQVVVDGDAAGSGSVEIDYSFGNETTGQPGIGFDDIVSVAVNTPDGGNVGIDNDETATLSNEHVDTQGYNEVKGTVTLTNLDAGEHVIVRLIVHLACQVGTPTGNILNSIDAARVVGDGNVSVGQQTVPMKQVGDVAQPGMNVDKSCPASAAIGDTISYSISIHNTGNEQLDITSVVDTVDGHTGVNITASFPGTVAVGATVTGTYAYTVLAADPDPLPNSVSVSASGHDSKAAINGSASCETDITHVPGIQVVKECPQTIIFGDDVTFTITITNSGNEALEQVTVSDLLLGGDITADFDFPDPFPAGGEVSHEFTYSPGTDEVTVENTVDVSGVGADSGVTATASASCSTDVLHPAIQIVKDGPAQRHVGDTITYMFEVTNPGELELFDVVLSDPICDAGTILPGADVDASLAVGEVWHFTCTHLITDTDPDPLPNTATVTGDTSEGEGGEQVSDTDDHLVDIIHPGISIVKTVDEEVVPIGTTVTFTYVIVNTGDTTLYNVSVDDDILGHIGDIPVLEVGGPPVTLTKDFVVGDEIVTNVGTATGEDVLGRSVSANDDATVAPISGENPPPNNPPTPFTGSDAGRLGIITMVLFGIGVTVVASTRRRRPKDEAA
jgi:uncharacterized repeat protein (TIGR01451 family)